MPEPLFLGEFFFGLRRSGIEVSVSEWMALMQALASGSIAPGLDEFYAVARALLVKDESRFDLYDQVFAAIFGGGEMPPPVKKELLDWLEDPVLAPGLGEEDRARLEALPLEKLRELFEQRLREQTERHDGGSHWIGTGGTSPFGHSGRNPAGIRVGGEGGGRSAVQVAGERRWRDYRADRVLDTRSISVALKKLRRLSRTEGEPELEVEESIEATAREGGELSLVFRPPRKNTARVVLLMDSGGSMEPFSRLVDQLFSAASALDHWKRFEALFFHNCPYAYLYRSYETGERIATQSLLVDFPKDTYLLVVGDASMAPSELTSPRGALDWASASGPSGLTWLLRLRHHFARSAWLNPLSPRQWATGYTSRLLSEVFPMFPLTLEGLGDAVDHLMQRVPAPPPGFDLEEYHRRNRPWNFL